MDELTAIDLFSGCGGVTVGLKDAGFRVIAAVEVAALAAGSYEANHPNVRLYETDIRQLSPWKMKRDLGLKKRELSLLAGCPPCQGFSRLRTLNGSKRVRDSRNRLVGEMLRFTEVLAPRAIMMENVPALLATRRFRALCAALDQLGYQCNADVLNAAHYGVPQRRRRLLLLAGLGFRIEFAERDPRPRTVRDAIRDLPKPGDSGDAIHDFPEHRSERIAALIREVPRNGGSRTDLPLGKQLPCHRRCDGFKDIYGRMAWDDPAPTITSGCFNPSKGRFLHPEEDRAITMREAALLQSFPRDYRFPADAGKSATAYLIGNALPPGFVSAHASKVASYLVAGSQR